MRRLEAPERREAADASAAQLTLLGVVRKVRARAHVHVYAGSAAPVAMPCSCQPGCWRRAWPLASVGLALPRTNIIHRPPPLPSPASCAFQVEAAERLGIDLSPPGAAECFSVLDDIVGWVESPPPSAPARCVVGRSCWEGLAAA